MGTERFREDISEALKRFVRSNPGQRPIVLKINWHDVPAWHQCERSKLSIADFVNVDVRRYTESIRLQGAELECSVELLPEDDQSATRFE